jgi:hypothetical protein
MIKLRGFLMTAASAAAICGLIALFSPTPVGAQKSSIAARSARNDRNQARSFVTKTENLSIPGTPGDIRTLYTVPAGKILVVEQLSAYASAPPGESVSLLLYGTSGGRLSYVFPTMQFQGTLPGGLGDAYGMFSPSDTYFDPGTTVNLFADKSGSGCCSTVLFQFSGYW